MSKRLIACAAAALLAACSTSGPPPPVPASKPQPKPAAPSLADEQRWLHQLFRGTPVVVALDDSGTLLVDVPLKFSFEPGRSVVMPPLGAVLDRVSLTMKRKPGTRVAIASLHPPERSESVRDYLVGKGIAKRRVAVDERRADSVELRIAPPVAAIGRLDDPPETPPGRVTPPAR